jgi:hypothetical protein
MLIKNVNRKMQLPQVCVGRCVRDYYMHMNKQCRPAFLSNSVKHNKFARTTSYPKKRRRAIREGVGDPLWLRMVLGFQKDTSYVVLHFYFTVLDFFYRIFWTLCRTFLEVRFRVRVRFYVCK